MILTTAHHGNISSENSVLTLPKEKKDTEINKNQNQITKYKPSQKKNPKCTQSSCRQFP
jgi:hypothetical protein